MKKMVLLVAMATIFGVGVAQAQSMSSGGSDYTTALGIRIGYPFGVSLKHFVAPHGAVEGILGFGYGFNLTALYEYHGDISGASGLKWYAGGGLSFYSWRNYGGSLGVVGILGLDYKIPSAPIDLSLDWMPGVYFTGFNGFEAGGGGLGIRYTF